MLHVPVSRILRKLRQTHKHQLHHLLQALIRGFPQQLIDAHLKAYPKTGQHYLAQAFIRDVGAFRRKSQGP